MNRTATGPRHADPSLGTLAPTEKSPTYRPGATRLALAAAQKSSKGAPAYSRYVNRPAGRVLAGIAYQLRMTPNMITAVSATLSFAAIATLVLARPTLLTGVLVCAGLVLGYAFDAADGQLARLRGGGTPAGEWLDHMVDATKISSLHLAVLVAAYRFFDLPSPALLLVPIGFAIVAAVMFFGLILNEQLRRVAQVTTGTATDRGTTSLLRSLLVVPTDYGLLCVAFLLLGAPLLFFWVYGLIFLVNAIFMALGAVKWYRDMAALAPAPSGGRS